MKVNTSWLREWVDFTLPEEAVAQKLTMAGLEVDAITPVTGRCENVVVAEIVSVAPHPNADRLSVCTVRGEGLEPLQVVCGAANARPGIKVALAQIGAILPNGLKIKETKLRGVLSQGMLCSEAELGLAEHSEGIIELDKEAPVGEDLRTYLDLNDTIYTIDLTPNRADCLSVQGVARELAAINTLPFKPRHIPPVSVQCQEVMPVVIDDPAGCPRYCGRIIRNIVPSSTTPLWLAERLRRCGIRVIHPVVDVLNYVMLELGQPMHAFDLEKISRTAGIHVRLAKENEAITVLDGQKITLRNNTLIVADDVPLAIAGVMGGLDSAVTAITTHIFIESAFFSSERLAGIARQYGITSEAAHRFERGVDPQLAIAALERATELLLTIVKGEAGPIQEVCQQAYLPRSLSIAFAPVKVEEITGLAIPLSQMENILTGLGFGVDKKNTLLHLQVPSFRFDISQEVDIVEEIARVYGYDKIVSHALTYRGKPGCIDPLEQCSAQLSTWFRDRGYNETISYSFVDPLLQEALYPNVATMDLLNPISSELSQMRVSLWPGLLASMIHNIHRQQNHIRFFEIGRVFALQDSQLTEHTHIAGLITGTMGALHWQEETRTVNFYDLKGDLQSLLASLKLGDVTFKAGTLPALHPGQTAEILLGAHTLGWMGALHPRIQEELELSQEVYVFELNMAHLTAAPPYRYKPISRYPRVRRDLSFLIDNTITALQIQQLVEQTVPNDWLKSFDVFDIYTGSGIPAGKKSMAIALTLQDAQRTLLDDEINALINAIIQSLQQEFSIILRD